jgi:hypothetical protein
LRGADVIDGANGTGGVGVDGRPRVVELAHFSRRNQRLEGCGGLDDNDQDRGLVKTEVGELYRSDPDTWLSSAGGPE